MSDLTFISRFQPVYDETIYPTREWAIVGPEGATQVWARKTNLGELLGGLEFHTHATLEDCTNVKCHLLNGPCRHHGSNLIFEDEIKPNIKPFLIYNADFMRDYLTKKYMSYFRA